MEPVGQAQQLTSNRRSLVNVANPAIANEMSTYSLRMPKSFKEGLRQLAEDETERHGGTRVSVNDIICQAIRARLAEQKRA